MAINSNTQATLLRRLQDGADPLAWDQFFQRYWPATYALARHRGCSDHTAEEIVQEVMLKVFEQRDVFRYDPQRGRFRDWLATLVRNKVAEHRRRPSQRIRGRGGDSNAGLTERGVDTEPDERWEAVFEQSLLLALLDVVRRETKPEVYLAFELSALRGLPAATVAQTTGLSRHAIYRARKKVLNRLRQLAGTYPDDGRLQQRVKQALRSQPGANVERSLITRVEETIRSGSGGYHDV
jgi:RNA polymerase sigma-70 factor (ECF subfamily)